MEDLLKEIDTPSTFASISKYLTKAKCTYCGGDKLREEVLNVHVAGKNIAEVERMSFDNLLIWLGEVEKNISCVVRSSWNSLFLTLRDVLRI